MPPQVPESVGASARTAQLDDGDVALLAALLKDVYRRPRTVERHVEASVETRYRTETRVESQPEQVTVDGGPSPIGIAVTAAAALSAVGLIAAGHIALGFILGAVGIAFGAYLMTTQRSERTETELVERHVDVEVAYPHVVRPAHVVHEEVAADREVMALGLGSIAVHVIESSAGPLLYVPAAAGTDTVSFPMLGKPDAFAAEALEGQRVLASLDWLLKAGDPAAVRHEHGDPTALCGAEAELRQHLENTAGILADTRLQEVALPPAMGAGLFGWLDEAPTADTPLHRAIEGPGGGKAETAVAAWHQSMTQVNRALVVARSASLSGDLVPTYLTIGDMLTYGAFNFYCPQCNRKEVDALLDTDYSVRSGGGSSPIHLARNTRCLYSPDRKTWACETCEGETRRPIPIHRLLDEVLLPTYDRLMDENRERRVAAHSRTRQQQAEHRATSHERAAELNLEQCHALDELGDLAAAMRLDIAGELEAIESMASILAAYNLRQNAVMKEISSFALAIERDVAERADAVLARIDEVKATEMRALEAEMTELAEAQRLEDANRDEVMRRTLSELETGFDRLEAAQHETTGAVREGTERTVAAQRETTSAVRDGTKQTIEAGQRNAASICGEIRKGTAVSAAVAKKNGVDVHDHAFWRVDKKAKHVLSDVAGAFTGRATYETEGKKL